MTTSTTTASTRTAYIYARGLLGVSVLLSLACNAGHAFLTSGPAPLWLTMGVGSIPPLILALSVEAVVFCSRHARLAWGWAAVLFAATAGLVTGFSMSFAAISDLGRIANMTAVTAPMLPVGIDALVITGLGMVALFRPRHLGEEAEARDAAPRVPQRFRRAVARVLGHGAAQSQQPVASRDTGAGLVAVRDAEQTAAARDVPTPDTVAEHRDTDLAEQAVTCDVTRDADDVPTEPITVSRGVEVAEQPVASRETQPVETVERGDMSRGTTPVATPERDSEYVRIATHLVDAGRTQASTEAVLIVLRGAAQGVPVRELAKAAGVSTGTVSRITKAAAEATAELALA